MAAFTAEQLDEIRGLIREEMAAAGPSQTILGYSAANLDGSPCDPDETIGISGPLSTRKTPDTNTTYKSA